MEVHGPNGVDGMGRVPPVRPGDRAREPAKSSPAPPAGDQVQISLEAKLKSLLSQVPEVRENLVERVRREIDAGTYLTDEKLDIAIERLLEDL